MRRFLVAITGKVIGSYLKDIPISSLRCEKKRVFVEEGWGGGPFENFPACVFFKRAVEGDEAAAIASMEKWYYERLIDRRLYSVAKAEGGMHGGSLCRLTSKLHQTNGIELKGDFGNADDALVRQAIKMRTQDRFDLLNSIRQYGYRCEGDYVSVEKEGDFYILRQGHHRVAALAACGYSSVAAATSRPIVLRVATKLARVLLSKERDHHSDTTKRFLADDSSDFS